MDDDLAKWLNETSSDQSDLVDEIRPKNIANLQKRDNVINSESSPNLGRNTLPENKNLRARQSTTASVSTDEHSKLMKPKSMNDERTTSSVSEYTSSKQRGSSGRKNLFHSSTLHEDDSTSYDSEKYLTKRISRRNSYIYKDEFGLVSAASSESIKTEPEKSESIVENLFVSPEGALSENKIKSSTSNHTISSPIEDEEFHSLDSSQAMDGIRIYSDNSTRSSSSKKILDRNGTKSDTILSTELESNKTENIAHGENNEKSNNNEPINVRQLEESTTAETPDTDQSELHKQNRRSTQRLHSDKNPKEKTKVNPTSKRGGSIKPNGKPSPKYPKKPSDTNSKFRRKERRTSNKPTQFCRSQVGNNH